MGHLEFQITLLEQVAVVLDTVETGVTHQTVTEEMEEMAGVVAVLPLWLKLAAQVALA
jgi:hypothetical protein